MSKPSAPTTIVVFTGNSNVGSAAIEALYAKQQLEPDSAFTIRAVVRKESNVLPEWEQWGMEIVYGDINFPDHHEAIFKSASAALWVPPTTKDRVELTHSFMKACIMQGVDYPVTLSMVGVGKGTGTHFDAFRTIEDNATNLAGTKVREHFWSKGLLGNRKQVLQPIILRQAQFYQNMNGMITTLKTGKLFYPLGDNGRMPHVDVADIGAVAAAVLVNPAQWANPDTQAIATLNVVAEYASGGAIARKMNMMQVHPLEIAYEPVSTDVAKVAFANAGLVEWVVDANLQVLTYYQRNEDEVESDIQKVLGRKHSDFKAFAKELKQFVNNESN